MLRGSYSSRFSSERVNVVLIQPSVRKSLALTDNRCKLIHPWILLGPPHDPLQLKCSWTNDSKSPYTMQCSIGGATDEEHYQSQIDSKNHWEIRNCGSHRSFTLPDSWMDGSKTRNTCQLSAWCKSLSPKWWLKFPTIEAADSFIVSSFLANSI